MNNRKRNWMEAIRGKREGKVTILDRTDLPKGSCQASGCNNKGTELRPYGKHSEWICYDCAQKDPETTQYRIGNLCFGEPLPDHLSPAPEYSNPEETEGCGSRLH